MVMIKIPPSAAGKNEEMSHIESELVISMAKDEQKEPIKQKYMHKINSDPIPKPQGLNSVIEQKFFAFTSYGLNQKDKSQ